MDDLEIIRTVAAAPEPSAHTTFQARDRLASAIRGEGPRGGSRWRSPLTWSLSGSALLAGVATFAMLAPAGNAVGHGGNSPGTGVTAQASRDMSPRAILLAAATTAEKEQVGRYWRIQKVGPETPVTVGVAPNRYTVVNSSVTELWWARNPSDPSWSARIDLGYAPVSQADRTAWVADGSPTRWTVPADTLSGSRVLTAAPGKAQMLRADPPEGHAALHGYTAAQFQQLPTDPAALQAFLVDKVHAVEISSGATIIDTNTSLFSLLQWLLLDAPTPPQVRAAAFKVLAGLPGIQSLGEVKDATGRPGIGISMTRNSTGISEITQIVIDGSTYQILGTSYSASMGGKEIKAGRQTVEKAEWTDATPTAPTAS